MEKNLWSVLETLAPTLIYQRGSMVYWQGDTADRLYYLKKGSVKIFLTSPEGGERTLRVQQTGGVFGEAAFFDGGPRISSAKVLEKSEIVAVSRQALLDSLQKEPELALYIMRALSARVRLLSSQVDSLAFLQADRRLARFLAEATGGTRTLPLTDEELGERIGASRVTVSRSMKKLREKGWIRSSYRAVEVLDADALFAYADGEEPPLTRA